MPASNGWAISVDARTKRSLPEAYSAFESAARSVTGGAPEREPIRISAPLDLRATKRKCSPSGRKRGCRWLESPDSLTSVVRGFASPPAAGTTMTGPVAEGAKTTRSRGLQEAPLPRSALASVTGGPPASAIFRSWLSVKKPICFESGDQKG